MLRNSSLFQFKHGDHICVFYRNEDALREVLVPYIAEGLRNGERCFCAQKPYMCRQLLYDLNFLGVNTEQAIRNGALEIHTEDEAYFPNKRFEPSVMMDMLMRSLEDALAKGFTGLRTAGELSWAAQGQMDCDQLLKYEKEVNECFPGKAAIGLCQYDMNEFAPEVLDAVVEAHRLNVAQMRERSLHAGIMVRTGNYSAEIVADRFVVRPNYYYVVQQKRTNEIVGWGVASTFDDASRQAERMVNRSYAAAN